MGYYELPEPDWDADAEPDQVLGHMVTPPEPDWDHEMVFPDGDPDAEYDSDFGDDWYDLVTGR
jgi:hypothetical protein